MIGKALAHYRVVAPLGAGGMGEVFRAQDTKLGREVALKVLPEAFARDPERLARFEREARLLASLSHPNIAAIHGLEEADGVRFLVLELVEGQTLAERLAGGRLPIEEALLLCRQIAEALEAAHEKGVIHRDLKPANVKVTHEGKVKVLDFGLAKAFGGDESAADLSKSPTLTNAATQRGVLLGTAAYMSPEQARGKPVDKRTDIWSFGCVLYEALTGQQAFSGETISDTVASILRSEPDWKALPAETSASLRALLQRCLQKDPARRLHDIADARIELEETSTAAPVSTPTPFVEQPRGWRRPVPLSLALGAALLGALLAGVAVWQGVPPRPAPQPVTRFSLVFPPDSLAVGEYPAVALSPDGARLVYVASQKGTTQLYFRAMDRLEATPIPGTEGGRSPFFSPDGQWIGFYAGGKLLKVAVSGGAPVILCDSPNFRGGSWGPDSTIVFSPGFSTGLSRVSSAGGNPQVLTTPDPSRGERTHRWPEVLPGGKAVVLTVGHLNSPDYYLDARIAVLSLETGKMKFLPIEGTNVHYAASGHLLYAGAGSGFAVPFDLARLEVAGPAVPVVEKAAVDATSGAAHFALSGQGSLVYVPGSPAGSARNLLWVDRTGTAQLLSATPHLYRDPRLSPDGKRLALTIADRNDDVWVYEFARGTLTRLTFEPGASRGPQWTPDGRRIAFSGVREGRGGLFWKLADGSGPEERLTTSQLVQLPEGWSPDGKLLAFSELDPTRMSDLWLLPLEGDRKPQPFLQTKFDEWGAACSPDGLWLAYVSDESGRQEVYVRPFAGPGGKWQISTQGGAFPVWARTGRELFYWSEGRLMSVVITSRPSFTAGTPRLLFEGLFDVAGPTPISAYDVSPDGQRFIALRGAQPETPPTEIQVVLNWFEELKRRVPLAK